MLVHKVIEIHKRAEQAVLSKMPKQFLAQSIISQSFSQADFPHAKSLNNAARNRESSRISKENFLICNRITNVPTSGYSDSKKHLERIKNLKSLLSNNSKRPILHPFLDRFQKNAYFVEPKNSTRSQPSFIPIKMGGNASNRGIQSCRTSKEFIINVNKDLNSARNSLGVSNTDKGRLSKLFQEKSAKSTFRSTTQTG